MLYKYDATNEKCPVPLVNLRLLLKKITCDDRCILKIKDEGSKQDIPALLLKKNFSFKQREIDNHIVEITITKDK